MTQKIKCKMFSDHTTASIADRINTFLDKPGREFVSATQSESHGGHFGDLNITITIWYLEANKTIKVVKEAIAQAKEN